MEWGFPQIRFSYLGVPTITAMLGSILGSPYFEKLPNLAMLHGQDVGFLLPNSGFDGTVRWIMFLCLLHMRS